MKRIALIAAFALICSGSALAAGVAYDVTTLNGHPGYLTGCAVSPDGVWDKVIMVVSGYDTENTDHPLNEINNDARFASMIADLGPQGWDVILFDYVDGSIDIHQNADNLARFIEVLNGWSVPNYHLALVGGSMGGIVTRAMFCQENTNMGTDTFVSLDSPQHGVYLSQWIKGLATLLVDTPAGYQMAEHRPEFGVFYGWMRGIETSTWKAASIAPMATLAIALSNGESTWKSTWGDRTTHTIYHPVCSYVYDSGAWSDYMPYHSTVMTDNKSTSYTGSLTRTYRYVSTATSYFDQKQPNPQTEHSGPDFAIDQAEAFVLAHGPAN
ncbi:MAG: hypothetical protein HYV27_07770 [Candidatus Hydrogenedentes bacterium]|nr:hypothetical protein [Candidatus Hydrogenedentota bacterium]